MHRDICRNCSIGMKAASFDALDYRTNCCRMAVGLSLDSRYAESLQAAGVRIAQLGPPSLSGSKSGFCPLRN